MSAKYQARIHEIDEYAIKLRDLIPETMKAYGALGRAAQAQGTLDAKTKELIALALGVATHCDGCLAYHARAAHKLGASRQEVAETLAVAIQMGGGPSVNYAADALRAYDEFAVPRPT
jgi:AhpD family alkylhydroperoxidase